MVSWFCELREVSSTRSGVSPETKALLSLLYALIRQLIELLPLKPKDPINVDMNEIRSLDGSTSNIDAAMRLLQDLIMQMDAPLFIVVDGLQWLDDVSTNSYLLELVKTLTSAGASTHRPDNYKVPLVRILFTTTGRSHALLDALDAGEYLLADEGGHSRRSTGRNPFA